MEKRKHMADAAENRTESTQEKVSSASVSPVPETVFDRASANDPSYGQSQESFTRNPLHTGVTKDTASTPGYFRLLLPGLAGRYILRWGVDESKDIKTDWARLQEWRTQSPDTKSAFSQLPKNDAEYIRETAKNLREAVDNKTMTLDAAKATSEAAVARRLMWHNGIAEERLDNVLAREESLSVFKRDVSDRIGANRRSRVYDYSLGAASVALSVFYDLRVASDMKKVYAETVAYEMGKKPEDVTFSDLMHSQNALVESTKHSFLQKVAGRFATDAIFFAGGALEHIPRMGWLKKYAFTDLGVGVKGASLIHEVLEKKTTILEDLMQLIDTKMNPLKGLGAPISSADIFDLYQKYTQLADPNATFHDALSTQNNDGRDWNKAQTIFQRVSELMNETYKYKHIGKFVGDQHHEKADFALPKFLYLLGNGLIDTYKPEETLAFVEVANSYGVPAVKQLHQALQRGVPLSEALEGYPRELHDRVNRLKSEKEPAGHAPSHPGTRVHDVSGVAMQSSQALQHGL